MEMRQRKITRTLTLSVYEYGNHRTDGCADDIDIEQEKLSFKESLLEIKSMIQELKDWPLGSKIQVTFEVLRKPE